MHVSENQHRRGDADASQSLPLDNQQDISQQIVEHGRLATSERLAHAWPIAEEQFQTSSQGSTFHRTLEGSQITSGSQYITDSQSLRASRVSESAAERSRGMANAPLASDSFAQGGSHLASAMPEGSVSRPGANGPQVAHAQGPASNSPPTSKNSFSRHQKTSTQSLPNTTPTVRGSSDAPVATTDVVILRNPIERDRQASVTAALHALQAEYGIDGPVPSAQSDSMHGMHAHDVDDTVELEMHMLGLQQRTHAFGKHADSSVRSMVSTGVSNDTSVVHGNSPTRSAIPTLNLMSDTRSNGEETPAISTSYRRDTGSTSSRNIRTISGASGGSVNPYLSVSATASMSASRSWGKRTTTGTTGSNTGSGSGSGSGTGAGGSSRVRGRGTDSTSGTGSGSGSGTRSGRVRGTDIGNVSGSRNATSAVSSSVSGAASNGRGVHSGNASGSGGASAHEQVATSSHHHVATASHAGRRKGVNGNHSGSGSRSKSRSKGDKSSSSDGEPLLSFATSVPTAPEATAANRAHTASMQSFARGADGSQHNPSNMQARSLLVAQFGMTSSQMEVAPNETNEGAVHPDLHAARAVLQLPNASKKESVHSIRAAREASQCPPSRRYCDSPKQASANSRFRADTHIAQRQLPQTDTMAVASSSSAAAAAATGAFEQAIPAPGAAFESIEHSSTHANVDQRLASAHRAAEDSIRHPRAQSTTQGAQLVQPTLESSIESSKGATAEVATVGDSQSGAAVGSIQNSGDAASLQPLQLGSSQSGVAVGERETPALQPTRSIAENFTVAASSQAAAAAAARVVGGSTRKEVAAGTMMGLAIPLPGAPLDGVSISKEMEGAAAAGHIQRSVSDKERVHRRQWHLPTVTSQHPQTSSAPANLTPSFLSRINAQFPHTTHTHQQASFQPDMHALYAIAQAAGGMKPRTRAKSEASVADSVVDVSAFDRNMHLHEVGVPFSLMSGRQSAASSVGMMSSRGALSVRSSKGRSKSGGIATVSAMDPQENDFEETNDTMYDSALNSRSGAQDASQGISAALLKTRMHVLEALQQQHTENVRSVTSSDTAPVAPQRAQHGSVSSTHSTQLAAIPSTQHGSKHSAILGESPTSESILARSGAPCLAPSDGHLHVVQPSPNPATKNSSRTTSRNNSSRYASRQNSQRQVHYSSSKQNRRKPSAPASDDSAHDAGRTCSSDATPEATVLRREGSDDTGLAQRGTSCGTVSPDSKQGGGVTPSRCVQKGHGVMHANDDDVSLPSNVQISIKCRGKRNSDRALSSSGTQGTSAVGTGTPASHQQSGGGVGGSMAAGSHPTSSSEMNRSVSQSSGGGSGSKVTARTGTVSVTFTVNSAERVTGSTKCGTGNTTGGDTEAFTSTEGVTSMSGDASTFGSDQMVPVATEENTVVKSALQSLLGERMHGAAQEDEAWMHEQHAWGRSGDIGSGGSGSGSGTTFPQGGSYSTPMDSGVSGGTHSSAAGPGEEVLSRVSEGRTRTVTAAAVAEQAQKQRAGGDNKGIDIAAWAQAVKGIVSDVQMQDPHAWNGEPGGDAVVKHPQHGAGSAGTALGQQQQPQQSDAPDSPYGVAGMAIRELIKSHAREEHAWACAAEERQKAHALCLRLAEALVEVEELRAEGQRAQRIAHRRQSVHCSTRPHDHSS